MSFVENVRPLPSANTPEAVSAANAAAPTMETIVRCVMNPPFATRVIRRRRCVDGAVAAAATPDRPAQRAQIYASVNSAPMELFRRGDFGRRSHQPHWRRVGNGFRSPRLARSIHGQGPRLVDRHIGCYTDVSHVGMES